MLRPSSETYTGMGVLKVNYNNQGTIVDTWGGSSQ
jgi:hypothetical protein